MFKLISLLFTSVFLLLGILLGVLNPDPVSFNFYFYTLQFPLGLGLAIMLVIGMLLGAVLIKMQVTQLKWRLGKQTRLNQKQSDEVVQLKKKLLEATRNKPKNSQQAIAHNENMPIGS